MNIVEPDELAAVERDDDREGHGAADRRRDDPRHAKVGVQHVEGPGCRDRPDGGGQPAAHEKPAKRARAVHAPDVVDCRAEQRIVARVAIVVQDEHMHVVTAGKPFDEPEHARDDALAAGAIDAAGHDQTDAHAHQHLTEEDS